METTIAGVVGEQLPRHPDWAVTDSDPRFCRWERADDTPTPPTLVLGFTDGEWSVSARVAELTTDEVGDDVLSHKLTLVEADSLFAAIDQLQEWMETPPRPTDATSE